MRAINVQAVRMRVERLADSCRRDCGLPRMTLEELVARSWGEDRGPAGDDSYWLALMTKGAQ